MKEAQWLVCANPEPMLAFLKDRLSERKFRLFDVALARLLPPHDRAEQDEERGRAIATAELFADGRASKRKLTAAARCRLGAGYWTVAQGDAFEAAQRSIDDWYLRDRQAELADLLREIAGNPFRPVALDPSWRTSDAQALARTIYDERAFERMPILGDALEDAGCTDQASLDHCRRDGHHVRSCWVVDLVLLKE
jgi:hypothetical protein